MGGGKVKSIWFRYVVLVSIRCKYCPVILVTCMPLAFKREKEKTERKKEKKKRDDNEG